MTQTVNSELVFDANEKLATKETISKLLSRFDHAVLDISDFEVIRVLGEGAFATVYKCTQRSTDRFVAVKVLKPQLVKREQDVYDFLLEAQLLHKLKDHAIVDFLGICYGQLGAKRGQESLCVVTEFMESGTLKDWIQAQTWNHARVVYSKRMALQWMIEIAKGLDYLHTRRFSIVHRDLKPENILLQPKASNPRLFSAKLADFGLSVMVSSRQPKADVQETQLDGMSSDVLPELLRHGQRRVEKTPESLQKALADASFLIRQEGELPPERLISYTGSRSHVMTGKTGSLLYMAPEVLRCEKYNEKVDVFSFATVLYETLQGYRIAERFGTKYTVSEVQKFAEQVRDGYRLPIPVEWPEELRSLISECWNGNPEERPSIRKVARRLSSMYNSGMFAKAPQKPKKPRCPFRFLCKSA